jgi:Lon protease-like protein
VSNLSMEKYLPFFPLNLVVYPNENLNLHIFEPRYKQLINECLEAGTTFGIPSFINNKLPGYGTEIKVLGLYKRFDDGQMDIKTQGIRAFRILSFENPIAGKLYAGGKVAFVRDETEPEGVIPELLLQLSRLYTLLQTEVDFDAQRSPFSYQVAHKVGLSVEEEYQLLTIERETNRQRFLLKHLNRVIPVMVEMERTKERIKLNGHFKNLDPLNF